MEEVNTYIWSVMSVHTSICMCRLSALKCQACNVALLPDQAQLAATAAGAKKKRGAKNMTHIRANCGHYLHYHCLNTMLTTPPFLHHCVTCKRQVGHPDWIDDIKQLERAWLLEQAKKRELVREFVVLGVNSSRL